MQSKTRSIIVLFCPYIAVLAGKLEHLKPKSGNPAKWLLVWIAFHPHSQIEERELHSQITLREFTGKSIQHKLGCALDTFHSFFDLTVCIRRALWPNMVNFPLDIDCRHLHGIAWSQKSTFNCQDDHWSTSLTKSKSADHCYCLNTMISNMMLVLPACLHNIIPFHFIQDRCVQEQAMHSCCETFKLVVHLCKVEIFLKLAMHSCM